MIIGHSRFPKCRGGDRNRLEGSQGPASRLSVRGSFGYLPHWRNSPLLGGVPALFFILTAIGAPAIYRVGDCYSNAALGTLSRLFCRARTRGYDIVRVFRSCARNVIRAEFHFSIRFLRSGRSCLWSTVIPLGFRANGIPWTFDHSANAGSRLVIKISLSYIEEMRARMTRKGIELGKRS